MGTRRSLVGTQKFGAASSSNNLAAQGLTLRNGRSTPAEARGGRNAAIGFGVAAGVLGAAAAANAANNGYYYGPRYGYYGGGPYAYYDDGPRYYRRGYHRYYDAW